MNGSMVIAVFSSFDIAKGYSEPCPGCRPQLYGQSRRLIGLIAVPTDVEYDGQ
jgi:hypothetical protein